MKKPTIIGYITASIKDQVDYWSIKRIGEISGLMVAEPYRRKGIATRLLQKARNFFIDKDIHYITTFTAVANRAAIEFYASNQMKPLLTTFLGDLESKN